MAPSDTTVDPVDLRTQVVAASIRLFSEYGYESTTVDQIAADAGVSRRTLFRQFRSKEDMIFADHEALIAQVAERLGADEFAPDESVDGPDPWTDVCDAAEIVFTHFLATRDLAVRRLRVVTRVPALRDRELVTTYRYQRVFEEFLRRRLPDESPERIVAFAAAVTSVHNYLLRSMIRGDADATVNTLRTELRRIRLALGADDGGDDGAGTAITVVTHPIDAGADQIARAVAEEIRAQRSRRT
ncbi:TetR/AcrR family transcriptional regulator [Gordonia polyisoprenivorans]|uniref:TetR/AcrR family transcriptional regulator n=1 Tax=Gordonia polyisoprenivorans TaxID=84595 RepID=A0A846WFT2_9ACTN|nr:TetR/AcrR family transcriptional regulator [Gordonia polyisoprenivorans]NKY00318.1 TetR/AcrR family transcriptional regulator [Gordonia polyisoprenivorans]WCB38518.1 helix-turn-helix domain containing protein [Gordonia polyisoprenivorans]